MTTKNANKKNLLVCPVLVLMTLWVGFAFAQPYGFSNRPSGLGSEILRTNLATNSRTHFLSTGSQVYQLFGDPWQRWLFHLDKGTLYATNITDTSNSVGLETDLTDQSYVAAAIRSQDRYIITWTLDTAGALTAVSKILNATTLSVLDSLSGDVPWAEAPFLSLDESTLYFGIFDTTARERYLEAFSLSSKSVAWRRRLFDIGPPTSIKIVEGGKQGKALIGYNYPTSANTDNHYLVYDPLTTSVSPACSFPYRERALLSPTATRIIAQRVDLDSTVQGWNESLTGDVWVFNVATGQTLQKLKFPPRGDVVVFDTDTAHFYYHIDSTDTWIRGGLVREPVIKGGISFPSSYGSLSIKAKPSVSYTQTDTLMAVTATIRWPAQFTSVTLGSVSSSYGITKLDTPVNVGAYKYQKFTTTQKTGINWLAGQEYELFSVPVQGISGAEQFELTNALSGGEWFVSVDYTDRTDSSFYQSLAQGYAFQNRSATVSATWSPGARHAALHGTTFHETYYSAGEIIYRRKDINSSTWDVTTRLSTGNGNNSDPNIIVAHDGSVHVVWQQQLSTNSYALWYCRSTNGGTTWTAPYSPAGAQNIQIDGSTQWYLWPVLAEYGTTKLVAVVSSINGPKYLTSSDLGASWGTLSSITGVTSPSSVWFLSMSRGSNFLTLSYDTRWSGVFSKKYDGTNWLTELSVNSGTGTYSDRCSSVAVDGSDVPHVAWCAQRSSEYRILYRSGLSGGNGWDSYYTEFPYTSGVSDLYPSISAQQQGGITWRLDVLWVNSVNQILLNQRTYEAWAGPRVVSSNGQAASTTLQEARSPQNNSIRLWTDMTASPYEVKRTSDGSYQLQSAATANVIQTELHRRVSLESPRDGASISYELAPLKVVTSAGDTTILPFKAIDKTRPLQVTTSSAWDYLGSDSVLIPANARSLIIAADIRSVVRSDSLAHQGTQVFTALPFRVDLVRNGISLSAMNESQASSGTRTIDLTPWVGQTVRIHPAGPTAGATTAPLTVGVGDIYVERKTSGGGQ